MPTLDAPTQEEIQQFMLGLAARNEGLLNPRDVVEAARPEESPIHGRFTWDDGEAADQYRLWEARQLIRVTVHTLPVDGRNIETRVFVSLTSDRSESGGYRIMANVLNDDDQRRQLLADALRELRTFEAKYSEIRELAKVMTPIRRVLQQHQGQQMSRPV